jgi:two-component system phosphate regulon sensor histidine kinase PhoR
MILTENQRMKKQADKILQMAVLEEGDYELHFEEINVHDLITDAVAAVQLHIDARHGSIESQLEATRCHLMADRVHLANIIHNLLDNANKYTPSDPRIVVSTKNQNSGLIIELADNGIGIPPENLTNVFEKYYRVSTGNIHNVKGFGLGLSYVRLMTEAMRGNVTIESQPGVGTTVRLSFPAATLVD